MFHLNIFLSNMVQSKNLEGSIVHLVKCVRNLERLVVTFLWKNEQK